jgi:hypothetical protein
MRFEPARIAAAGVRVVAGRSHRRRRANAQTQAVPA